MMGQGARTENTDCKKQYTRARFCGSSPHTPRYPLPFCLCYGGRRRLARPKVGVSRQQVEQRHGAWDDHLGRDETVDQDAQAEQKANLVQDGG